MKHGITEINYMVREPKTYLTATLAEDAELQEFCLEMAARNRIPGVLPVTCQFEDGNTVLAYDISGMRRISDVLMTESKKDAVFLLFGNLIQVFRTLPDYFLHASQCMLSCDCVFVDRYFQVGLALAPMKSDTEDSSAQLRQLFMDALSVCTTGSRAQQEYANLLAYLIRPEFHMDDFAKILETGKGNTPDAEVKMASAKPMPAVQPAKPREEPVEKKQAEKKIAVPNAASAEKGKNPSPDSFAIPGAKGGFAIPGGGSVPESKKKPDRKEKNEKSGDGHKVFGISFGKKKVAPEVSLNEEAHIISGGTPDISISSAVPPVPKASGHGESQEQWHGTVSFENYDNGKTEFCGFASAEKDLMMFYNGRTISVDRFPFTVGRTNCDFIIDSNKVSRHHITLTEADGSFFVQDESSSNHTYIDGVMIPPYSPCALHDGAELRLGNERITVCLEKHR